MCGIVGTVGVERPALSRMNAVFRYRGPDDAGEYYDEEQSVGLGMRRLSILDIAGGHQPMSAEDGRYVVVFNGEIFNSPELRRELEARGVRFATSNSDTEVLLHLYRLKGPALLRDLNGMFAFVIYDRQRRVLFGARDRVGIKPLYFTQHGSSFAFASELKCLFPLPWMTPQVDVESLFHYMSLRFVPGERAIVRGAQRLPPGHWFEFDLVRRSMRIERYWQLRFSPEEGMEPDDWKRQLRHELGAAVRRWMLSDVPVGCSLSGGLDSSAIVGLAVQQGNERLRTYSLGFTGPGEKHWNELPIAAAVAQKWGTDHHEFVLTPDRLLDDLVKMVWHLDEPYGGGLPSWYVFKAMRQDVTVGLTGSGGDELFGDYGRFLPLEPSGPSWWPVHRPQPFRRGYFERFYYLADDVKRQRVLDVGRNGVPETGGMLEQIFDVHRSEGESPRDGVARVAFDTQLPEEFLLMTDRFSMAHSLEARVPFLDHQFVEFVARIPARLRTKRRDLKYLLRESVADLLPREAIRAPKRGFVIPTSRWLRQQLRPLAEALLARDRLAAQGLFRPEFYDDYVRPHLDGATEHGPQVWTALMFQLWHVVFVERPQAREPQFSWRDLC